MRKQSLRQTANRYLKTDNRGSFKDKKHRAFVIQKMIDDLFIVGTVPLHWWDLDIGHIQKLIQHWQKQKISSATIMGYMTVIRKFLSGIGCQLTNTDNQNLGLSRQYCHAKKINVNPDTWQSISDPVPRFIMALQTQFGLTFSEAISFAPDIHFRDHALWITREIAFNSQDRMIPLRCIIQSQIINELVEYLNGSQCLGRIHSHDLICFQWRLALNERKLPVKKTWRYLYARQLYHDLAPVLGNYQTSWLIHDEMGIKSRNTLWLYLHE
ncbi:putative integrase [Legionella geestiana]|uniref:Putative integrase n=1 Tax=Legionella geestiana TaxID=45065 RepID=A0A0W0U8U3_9GAMM|nr:phage integrase N-terminal domain-containing protein [Legionella geestiana]KTD04402.1 putative integrase [Legionella geestiana]QBS13461.1 integrase [Legionella geestiana]QDQ41058.1 integrase [Legionella geestiana]STX54554.1 putative integrase [Legionella geestiana]